jgi:hypothetical protein
MGVKAARRGASSRNLITPSGQRDNAGAVERWIPTQLDGYLIPVHARHANVQKHDVRQKFLGSADRIQAAVRHHDGMSLQAHKLAQQVRRIHVVIDNKHAPNIQRLPHDQMLPNVCDFFAPTISHHITCESSLSYEQTG